MPRKRQTRHGATQPEGERERQQVKVRLDPYTVKLLGDLAEKLGVTKSQVVKRGLEMVADGSREDFFAR